MDRKQIETEYDVQDGVIRSPGKFEAEPIYAPYFYDAMLNGLEDETEYGEDDRPIAVFTIDENDRNQFPELGDVQVLRCFEDSQGFFYCQAS